MRLEQLFTIIGQLYVELVMSQEKQVALTTALAEAQPKVDKPAGSE